MHDILAVGCQTSLSILTIVTSAELAADKNVYRRNAERKISFLKFEKVPSLSCVLYSEAETIQKAGRKNL